MRVAFLSDAHGRATRLEAALSDAQRRGAGQIVSLGDVGDDACVTLLRQADALAVLGNYEVSGWKRLAEPNRSWVQSWPLLLAGETFLAVHAAPWWPEGLGPLASIDELAAWRQVSGHSWRALFPYLNEDDGYLWQALAELETAGKAGLFYGHTHRQHAWDCTPDGRLRLIRTRTFQLQPGHRYLIGVGSVGLPEDGAGTEYALYDEPGRRVELVRLAV
jgi:predicted phosphodiesterase